MGAGAGKPRLQAKAGCPESPDRRVHVVDRNRHMIEAGLLPITRRANCASPSYAMSSMADIGGVELGDAQADVRQIAALRREAAKQGTETADRRLQVGER